MKSDRFTLVKVIFTVGLFLLIAPIVIAEDFTNASSARAASAQPLPQFHFNNSQKCYCSLGG